MAPVINNDPSQGEAGTISFAHNASCQGNLNNIANVAALILAGGQSRRMGTDKALLTMPSPGSTQGISLLRHTCDVVQSQVSQTYVLTPWPLRYSDILPTSVTLLRETNPGQGPLVALAQGWSMILAQPPSPRSQIDWLLVLACDLPGLESALLHQWQRSLDQVRDDAIATLPRHQERWDPLCGFYHRRCLPSLHQGINRQVRSFQRWLTDEIVVALPPTDSHMLRNCNTPTEWQQFLNSADPS